MAERPSLGRDDSYNRVRISKDLKSQVMSMIADSSESLPLSSVSESEEDLSTSAAKKNAQPASEGASAAQTNGPSSKLFEQTNAADLPTPTPERPNPLEQVPTVRQSSPPSNNAADGYFTNGGAEKDKLDPSAAQSVDPVLATPTPLRSHEVVGTHDKPIAPLADKLVSNSDTDIEDAKETMGSTASRTTTVSQTPSNASGSKQRPGVDRTSTMKRISSALKRTVSRTDGKH